MLRHGLLAQYGTAVPYRQYKGVSTVRSRVRRAHTISNAGSSLDALNETLVKRDLLERLPGLNEALIRDVLIYAMAGAGFDVDAAKDLLNNASEAHLSDIKTHLHTWRNGRNPREFYQTLFEAYGYTCEDMLQRCKYADEVLPCCQIFRPTYVALRGRCFMLPGFHQHRPNYHGDLKVTFKQLPSWLLHRDGVQVSA